MKLSTLESIQAIWACLVTTLNLREMHIHYEDYQDYQEITS